MGKGNAVCFLIIILLLLLTSAVSMADAGLAGEIGTVVNVNEYVTLRDVPKKRGAEVDRIPLGGIIVYLGEDEGDFSRVSYRGRYGYVMNAYLQRQPREKGTEVSPDTAMEIRLNLFLTAFSDVWFNGSAAFTLDAYRDRELVDFAVDTLFKSQLEYGPWGDYNARVDGSTVPDMVRRWFGVEYVNVSDTRYEYRNGYYYSDETGGRSTGGFTVVERVEMLSEGLYRVIFSTYGAGEGWKPEAVCALTPERAAAMYPGSLKHAGEAVVDFHGHPEDEQQWTVRFWFVQNE